MMLQIICIQCFNYGILKDRPCTFYSWKIIPISSGGTVTQEQRFLGEKKAMSFHIYFNKEFLQQNFLVWYRYRSLKLIYRTCLKSMVIDSTRDLQS